MTSLIFWRLIEVRAAILNTMVTAGDVCDYRTRSIYWRFIMIETHGKSFRSIDNFSKNHCSYNHRGWTPFYFMFDPKCFTKFPWCTINIPAAFAWCTNHFEHKFEFSHIEWNGVHSLWLYISITLQAEIPHTPRIGGGSIKAPFVNFFVNGNFDSAKNTGSML